MRSEQKISEERFDTALQFIHALNPTESSWHPRSTTINWIFRGQEDASWNLIASAHRPTNEFPFLDDNCFRANGSLSARGEREIANRFEEMLRERGIDVPRFPTRSSSAGWYWRGHENSWPAPDDIPALALAQHEGLPTRLLDWTKSAYVAAYFAATGACRKQTSELAVWALEATSIEDSFFLPEVEHAGPLSLCFVKPPAIGNQRLVAQAGYFTYIAFDGDYETDNRALPPQDIYAIQHLQFAEPLVGGLLCAPAIRKLTLPSEHASELLHYLSKHGYDATTLFPGAVGAVRHLFELKFR